MKADGVSVGHNVVLISVNGNHRRGIFRNKIDGRCFLGDFVTIGDGAEPFFGIVLFVWTCEHIGDVGDTVPIDDHSDFEDFVAGTFNIETCAGIEKRGCER